MTKQTDDRQKYIKGVQGGYNKTSKRWHTVDGRIATRENALASTIAVSKDAFGGKSTFRFPTPITSSFEVLEANMASISDGSPMSGIANVLKATLGMAEGYQTTMQRNFAKASEDYEKLAPEDKNKVWAVQGFDKAPEDKPMANYMPVQQQARMNLAEHYWNTDGDALNICETPVEILTREIDVICPDKRLRKDIEDFKDEIRLVDRMAELWSEMREYGQSYPFEIWEDNGKMVKDIVPLPPKHVHIGYNWAFGVSALMVGQNTWTKSLLEAVFPPAMFRVLMRHWNDSPIATPGQGAFLPGDNLRPIFDKQRSFARYSMPTLSRGFRELVTRTVYEDSVRALVEGMRYQLWVIKVGDKDHPPMPQEITAIKDMLNGMSGEATGMFVWRDSPLAVEVHIPKGIDVMIGNDYAGMQTKAFFRKMGISSEVVSGELPGMLGSTGRGGGGGGGKGDIDVQIYIERARYQAQQVTSWAEYLVKKWALANGKPIKAISKIKLPFAPTVIEMENRIKNVFGPMYRDGALSHRTYVGAAGRDGEMEIEQKKVEQPYRELLIPPPTYAQVVLGPTGEIQKTSTQTEPQGSPTEQGEQANDIKRAAGVPLKRKEKLEP